jgi:hypothetical protein
VKPWFPSNWSVGSWQPFDPTYLLYEARTCDGRFLFTAKVMRLYDSECEFRDGRFLRFVHEAQPYKVTLRKSPVDGNYLVKWMGEMVDWIGQHAANQWSMDISMASVSDFTVDFTFADLKNAVIFALVWRGE